MKKKIGMVGVILSAVAVQAAPLVDKAVGTAVEKAVARELAGEVAEAGGKAVATRTMSSALAGLSARKAIGIGVGVGTAAALPIAAHELSDGEQEVDKARADVMRQIGEATAKAITNHPELAKETYAAINEGAQGGSGGVKKKIWNMVHLIAWGIGLVAALYLGGALVKALGFVRREVKMAFAPLATESSEPLKRPHEGGKDSKGVLSNEKGFSEYEQRT